MGVNPRATTTLKFLYIKFTTPSFLCWFNRPRLNQNVSVQATSLNQRRTPWFSKGVYLCPRLDSENLNHYFIRVYLYYICGSLQNLGFTLSKFIKSIISSFIAIA